MKTPFAEVDLLLESPEKILTVVEVKTLADENFLSFRLTKIQAQRLKRAVMYFVSKGRLVQFHLAVVSHDGHVQVIEDVFS